ncbi:hypothetical protein CLG96_09170 [Sphingomonas oleivorans]|uniref:Uncharacterized protein n=1 Tax=Sphingomonas oleivorans TaxID=1735121 RepID=A0A2T5FYG9_9SPHN|nr:Hsp20/alpha crystallin family protein [Sphingomonas oleivorans]PTQ11589.1 hypothetical protein CLG96_09170 [Sphingomonas oleivorans]
MARDDVQTEANVPSVVESVMPALTDPFGWMRGEMDRFWSGILPFGDGFRMAQRLAGMPVPAAEMTETDDAFRLTIEVPGVDPKDVEIEIKDDLLQISGEKRTCRAEGERGNYLSERSYGRFERSVRLPERVDREQIKATAQNGVLTITLPRVSKAGQEGRKIAVETL